MATGHRRLAELAAQARQGKGDTPTYGGMRPGPLALPPPKVRRRPGVLPVAIRIPAAEVDSEVEAADIVDGVMQNPSGPWVVGPLRTG